MVVNVVVGVIAYVAVAALVSGNATLIVIPRPRQPMPRLAFTHMPAVAVTIVGGRPRSPITTTMAFRLTSAATITGSYTTTCTSTSTWCYG